MDAQGRPSVPGGIPEQQFYTPDDEALRDGIAELAQVIGEEKANAPSMVRRLVRAKNNGAWLLAINDCVFISYGAPEFTAPHLTENATTPIRFGYGLAEGTEILASDSNPEKEITRRAALIDAKEKRDKAYDDEARTAEQARLSALRKAQSDAVTYRQTEWESLTTLERFAFALAVAVKPHDEVLAKAIRGVAEQSKRCGPTVNGARGLPLDCPRTEWWI